MAPTLPGVVEKYAYGDSDWAGPGVVITVAVSRVLEKGSDAGSSGSMNKDVEPGCARRGCCICICRIRYGVSNEEGAKVDTKFLLGAGAQAWAPLVKPVPTTQGWCMSVPT